MASPETIEAAQEYALEVLVREKLDQPIQKKAQKETRRKRIQDREAFLVIADGVLEEYGHPVNSEDSSGEIIETSLVSVQLPTSEASVIIQRLTQDHKGKEWEGKFKSVSTSLVFDDGNNKRHTLFSINQDYNAFNSAGKDLSKSYRTTILNGNGAVASNEEVDKGRQAITFIQRRLKGGA